MKVYLIYYDNGEEYGEYEEWVVKITSTREKAEKFIKDYNENGEFFKRIEEWEVS